MNRKNLGYMALAILITGAIIAIWCGVVFCGLYVAYGSCDLVGRQYVDDDCEPGTELFSQTIAPGQKIIVSRPRLPDELEELVRDEKLHCCLIYQRDSESEASTLILSCKKIGVSIAEDALDHSTTAVFNADVCYTMTSAARGPYKAIDIVSKQTQDTSEPNGIVSIASENPQVVCTIDAQEYDRIRGLFTPDNPPPESGENVIDTIYTSSDDMATFSATEYRASQTEIEALKMLLEQPLG